MREHAAERVEVEEARAPGEGARRRGVRGKRVCEWTRARPRAPVLRHKRSCESWQSTLRWDLRLTLTYRAEHPCGDRRPPSRTSSPPVGGLGRRHSCRSLHATILLWETWEKGFLISSVHTLGMTSRDGPGHHPSRSTPAGASPLGEVDQYIERLTERLGGTVASPVSALVSISHLLTHTSTRCHYHPKRAPA